VKAFRCRQRLRREGKDATKNRIGRTSKPPSPSDQPTERDQPKRSIIINLQYPLERPRKPYEAVKFEFQSVWYIAVDCEVKVISNFENPFGE